MAETIQAGNYTLSVPPPDSLNSTRLTYSVNNTTQTLSLTNEALREKTSGLKKEITQTQTQLNAAETTVNQAQTTLNTATAQLTQLVQQRPQFSRYTSYREQVRLEQEYKKKLDLAQAAVNTAKQTLEQARITVTAQQVELSKHNAELSVLQDIASKFPTLQQTSTASQLAQQQKQRAAQETGGASANQAADTIKTASPSPPQEAPIIGPTSNNYLAADASLTPEEQLRLRAATDAQLAGFATNVRGQPTRLTVTTESGLPNQVINATENTAGQKSPIVEEINKANKENTSENKTVSYTKKPYDNPLHEYVNYTYGLSLFALSPEDYKNLSATPKDFSFTSSAKRLLIASAGRREDYGAERSEYFEEDFYFDSLTIETVVGLNHRTRGTNAYGIGFTVLEPMGFTLFNRFLKTAEDLKIPNYLEMPFLLKIDFYGTTDIGEPMAPIPNQTKLMAIKLNECKTSISARGTEYQFRATPYHHQAFNQTLAETPVGLTVTASTVGEFFDAAGEGFSKTDWDASRPDAEQQANATARGNSQNVTASPQANTKKSYVVKSYTAAVNTWLRRLKDLGATEMINEIAFDIDPKIRDSKLVTPDKQKVECAPNSGNASTSSNVCATRTVTQATSLGINAGTDILKVIEMALQSSKFVQDQIINPESDSPEVIKSKKDKPMSWFKVQAAVELIGFDKNTNKWAKKIIYKVKEYIEPNVKHIYGPAARLTGAVKDYHYIYTGKNKDIIDLKIDFDMTFYTAIAVARERMEELGNKPVEGNPNPSAPVEKFGKSEQGAGATQAMSPQPHQRVPIAVNQKNIASGDVQKDSISIIVADVVQNMYSTTRGDMINVQLRIIGDPEFIKQDDLYLSPLSKFDFDYAAQFVGTQKDGDQRTGIYSLNFDSGAVLVNLVFQTPTDIDESTGQLKLNGKFQTGVFSGVYRVVTVTSEFRQGKFEQVLNLIRQFDQEEQMQLPARTQAKTISTTTQDESLINEPRGVQISDIQAP